MNKKLVFYVGTTKRNYIKNTSISLFLGIMISYMTSLIGWSKFYVLINFVLSTFLLFRLGEFIITKKSVGGSYIFGYIDEGREAKFNFFANLCLLVLIIISIFTISPN